MSVYIQIDYSLPQYFDNKDAYHMMPLLLYTKFALHNFIEWIGVKHFTEFVEDLAEFHEYPLWRLSHLVSSLHLLIKHFPIIFLSSVNL